MKTLIEWRFGGAPPEADARLFIVATIERAIRAQLGLQWSPPSPARPIAAFAGNAFRQAPKAHAAWLGALSSTIRTMSVMMRLSSKSFGV